MNITIYKLLYSSKRCGIPCFKCICTVNLTPDLKKSHRILLPMVDNEVNINRSSYEKTNTNIKYAVYLSPKQILKNKYKINISK